MAVASLLNGTMRPVHFPPKVGARIAIGLLAAIYLWNLTIVSNTLFHQEAAWNPIFPIIHTKPLQEESFDEAELEKRQGGIPSLSFDIPDSINYTLPPPEYRVPGFIVIGAQKSATQALRTYMSQHPLIHFPSGVVEPHFFDWGYRSHKSNQENLNAYIKLLNGKRDFDCRQKGCITGESTPSYIFATKHVPSRIKQICPRTKLIVVLRDPVKRAYSQCNMLIQKHEVKTSFREHFQFDRNWMKEVGLISNKTLTPEEENEAWNRYHKHRRVRKLILGRGLYEIQLRAWFQYFPREQFLILKSEELDINRTATMRRVFDFLGLHDQPLEKDKKVHTKHYTAEMSDQTRKELYDFYRPYNKRLEALLGPEWKDAWEEPSQL